MGKAASSVSRMRGFLALLLLVTAGAAFADDVFTGQDALAMDCPMVNTRIIGAQTEIWPDVWTWEECAIICDGVPACKFWTLSTSMAHNYCYLWSSMTGQAEIPYDYSGERGCLG